MRYCYRTAVPSKCVMFRRKNDNYKRFFDFYSSKMKIRCAEQRVSFRNARENNWERGNGEACFSAGGRVSSNSTRDVEKVNFTQNIYYYSYDFI